MRVVMGLSGGMDSVTLLYDLLEQGHHVFPVFFDYGQKHLYRERAAADWHCSRLGIMLTCWSARYFSNTPSALTDAQIAIPTGHYEDPAMRANVVSGRNLLFCSLLAVKAAQVNAPAIAIAAHQGDAAIYPDCRVAFMRSLAETIRHSTDGQINRILAPYLDHRKDHIVAIGRSLNVDYSQTYSCYAGGSTPCGKCGACVERQEVLGDV